MDMLMSQLVEEAFANVNVSVVLELMALGFIVKHVKFLENIDNNIIPPALLLCSVVAMTIMDGFTVESVISGIVNAAVAVGLHQQGKNIFTVTVVPSISKFFDSLKPSTEIEETYEEETYEEEMIDEEIDSEDTDI